MPSLEATLDTFAGLLAAEPPANVAKADEAIWAYLSAVQGLEAQVAALDRGLAGLDATAAFMPSLRDAVDRHRARLAEPSA